MTGDSLWPRLAGLPLVIEACGYERLYGVQAYEFERVTTHVRLVGAGVDGFARTSGLVDRGVSNSRSAPAWCRSSPGTRTERGYPA